MVKHSWARVWIVVAAVALVGGGLFAMSPATAELRSAAKSVWQQVKPKADKRYVKKADRSKIVRTANRSTDSSTSVTGTITPMSTNIKAPSNGYLVIQGHGVYEVGAATPLIHCGIAVDDNDGWTGNDGLSASVTAPAGPISCDALGRVPVAKGQHSVAYQVHNDGSGSLTFRGGSITVTFVAFGANGKPPVPKHSAQHRADVNR